MKSRGTKSTGDHSEGGWGACPTKLTTEIVDNKTIGHEVGHEANVRHLEGQQAESNFEVHFP